MTSVMPDLAIGDKVELIPLNERGDKEWNDPRSQRVEIGKVYTVREIDERAVGWYDHCCAAVRFEEIRNPVLKKTPEVGDWELAYDIRAFRKVTVQ